MRGCRSSREIDLRLAFALARNARRDGKIAASVKFITGRTGLSKTTANRAAISLQRNGALTRVFHGSDIVQSTSSTFLE